MVLRPWRVSLLLCVVVLVGTWAWLRRTEKPVTRGTPRAEMRVLFIGNSFVTVNDLPSLFQQLAENTLGIHVYVHSVSVGGARFADHLARFNDVKADQPIRRALLEERSDFVVLQEQSQLLGFARTDPEVEASFRAAKELARAARATGATVVLYGTWGFWPGDETNRIMYPDFITMNHRLAKGTEALADELTDGARPMVVPVGAAFERVHTADPLGEFRSLYLDERHPSLSGSYLAASMLVRWLGNTRVSESTWVPQGLVPERARRLRVVADSLASVE